MPIFIELVENNIMDIASTPGPQVNVGPDNVYVFNPATRVLSVNSIVEVDLNADLIIGITSVLQTPAQSFVTRQISQYPPSGAGGIEINSVEPESGRVMLSYRGETFALIPDEARTFKQLLAGKDGLSVIAQVSNHGRLAGIEEIGVDSRR